MSIILGGGLDVNKISLFFQNFFDFGQISGEIIVLENIFVLSTEVYDLIECFDLVTNVRIRVKIIYKKRALNFRFIIFPTYIFISGINYRILLEQRLVVYLKAILPFLELTY